MLMRCGYLQPSEKGLQLTNIGSMWLAALGIAPPARPNHHKADLPVHGQVSARRPLGRLTRQRAIGALPAKELAAGEY